MIKKIIKKCKSNTYQGGPPLIENPKFYKYLNEEVQFYRNMAKKAGGEFCTNKYVRTQKNLEDNIQ